MHDGAIVFNTKIDNSDVEKDLKAVEKKIQNAEASIQKNENAKLPLVKQAEELGAKLDEAKRNLEFIRSEMSAVHGAMAPGSDPADYMAASADYERVKAALDAQEKEVRDLQAEWDKVNDKVDVYDQKIEASRAEIQRSTEEVGRLRSKLGKGGNSLSGVFDKSEKSASKFGKRILSIGMSAFVFNLLSAGLRNAVGYMGKILQTNKQYTAQLAKLKAALLAAFQPIYEFILPGLLAIMRVLTAILTLFGQFLAWLTGKDYNQMVKNAQALYQQAGAIDAVGAAAEKASKSLAGFDEINQIGQPTVEGSSGGSGGVLPDFGNLGGDTEGITDSLSDLFELVAAIGAGFLAWKIAKHFTKDLKKIAGIALTVGGAAMYAFNWFDAFSTGIDWENLLGMLSGMGAVVGGLWLAFGRTGGAIGLLITGLGLLGVSLYEWITTGELTNESLAALEIGFLAVGAAISLLTGSWIPLLIAAVVGLVVAIATRSEEIKQWLQKLDDWIMGVFTTDWRETFGPVFGTILNGFCTKLQSAWETVRNNLQGWLTFLKGVFTGNWRQAWEGVKQIFRSVMNTLPGIAQSVMNAIINWVKNAINWVKNLISTILNARGTISSSGGFSGFSGGFAKGGTLSRGWGIVGEAGPEIIRMVNGRAIITPLDIPYLATGAVLPANKPFMAMVGDQRHGTNIEAPLSVIQEAVAEVMGDQAAAMLAGFEAVVQAIQEKNMTVVVGDKDIGEANARYSSRMAIRRGNA